MKKMNGKLGLKRVYDSDVLHGEVTGVEGKESKFMLFGGGCNNTVEDM